MNTTIQSLISSQSGISFEQVDSVIKLINEGSTIPFIARYRKEATNGLNEVHITEISRLFDKFSEIEKRKETIIATIEEQGKLTEELKVSINKCWNLSDLEDIYLPYKPKKKTRASVAMEKGLEPLAKIIMSQRSDNLEQIAFKFVNELVIDVEDALQGARDIIAEWINEHQYTRKVLRKLFENEAVLYASIIKNKKEDAQKYRDYFKFSEQLRRIPSHRFMAILRGENEGFLKVNVEIDEERAFHSINRNFVKSQNECAIHIQKATKDSYKRLLQPSMETEFLNQKKELADEVAIKVFTENLKQLLLFSPLGQKRIIAFDPGFRTGCKLVCLDSEGNLLENTTIFPHPPVNEPEKSAKNLQNLIDRYKTEVIAIGDGTAGRETYDFLVSYKFDTQVKIFMVNEDGASVYSASEVAREELGEYDLTVRGAVSIGRRLIDPLAELVKIDPKSIGVGQYQHDVNQFLLKKALDQTTESCVNLVGVELNTASKQLLTYVSGIGPQLAENIVEYRKQNGAFKSRNELKKVKRLGEKAFEQCAGFLRIKGAVNPLDNSAVHPESYYIVEKMAESLKCKLKEIIGNSNLISLIKPADFTDSKAGLPTINDIIRELEKPGRDPREPIADFSFAKDVSEIGDLKADMILDGIVSNITNFGAFIDIGVKQDGMVHISELADKFVKNPSEIVRLKQRVKVRIIDVDLDRKRIYLSMKGIN